MTVRVALTLDVQSFLWVISQKSGGPEPPILEVVGEHFIEAQGMRIDDRTLRRYHYALQSRGFVIFDSWLVPAEPARSRSVVDGADVALLGFRRTLDAACALAT